MPIHNFQFTKNGSHNIAAPQYKKPQINHAQEIQKETPIQKPEQTEKEAVKKEVKKQEIKKPEQIQQKVCNTIQQKSKIKGSALQITEVEID